ncbi:hypothetical protein P9D51_22965 [Bacillus sonorensis]|uniref:hypothetical protein n=1 Tax=Bacillus sonorensis TaxID=119858 RepID=UPI00227F398C|nr:hypothetical protein [Bacillus sonorensis]MCY8562200.1 hypothetical protein [Bacillus sonorensis]MEC1428906.1 hypothetical protein [Bacillus sonorensis]
MKVTIKKMEQVIQESIYHGGIQIKKSDGVSIFASVSFESGLSVEGDFYFPGEQDMSFSQAEEKIRELFADLGEGV